MTPALGVVAQVALLLHDDVRGVAAGHPGGELVPVAGPVGEVGGDRDVRVLGLEGVDDLLVELVADVRAPPGVAQVGLARRRRSRRPAASSSPARAGPDVVGLAAAGEGQRPGRQDGRRGGQQPRRGRRVVARAVRRIGVSWAWVGPRVSRTVGWPRGASSPGRPGTPRDDGVVVPMRLVRLLDAGGRDALDQVLLAEEEDQEDRDERHDRHREQRSPRAGPGGVDERAQGDRDGVLVGVGQEDQLARRSRSRSR